MGHKRDDSSTNLRRFTKTFENGIIEFLLLIVEPQDPAPLCAHRSAAAFGNAKTGAS
jgi:hypothetical protein